MIIVVGLYSTYFDLLVLVFSGVTNAVDHIQSGTDALQTAKNLQKNSRKCMTIAIILFLLIAGFMLLAILKQPWKKK
ncbi:SYP132 [Linum perenne]